MITALRPRVAAYRLDHDAHPIGNGSSIQHFTRVQACRFPRTPGPKRWEAAVIAPTSHELLARNTFGAMFTDPKYVTL